MSLFFLGLFGQNFQMSTKRWYSGYQTLVLTLPAIGINTTKRWYCALETQFEVKRMNYLLRTAMVGVK